MAAGEFLEGSRQTLHFIQAVSKLYRKIHNSISLEEIVNSIIDTIPMVFQVGYASIFLCESEENAYLFRDNRQKTMSVCKFSQQQNLLQHVFSLETTVTMDNFDSYQSVSEKKFAPLDIYEHLQNYCILLPILPLEYSKQTKPLGVLVVADRLSKRPFSELEQEVIQQLLEIVSDRITLNQFWDPSASGMREEQRGGALNWYPTHNYEQFVREIYRAMRYQSRLSMLILEIDNFALIKQHLDVSIQTYLLEESARIINYVLRNVDIVSRKKTCFLILLPETQVNDAMVVADRLRRAFAEHEFSVSDSTVPLTVSLGVTGFDARDNPISLVNKARSALARAQQQGNQISIYTSE